jgi:hypothetical protein
VTAAELTPGRTGTRPISLLAIGDSLSMAFGGASTCWPEELQRILTNALARPVTLTMLSRHLQTAERSARRQVPRVAKADADVVVIAHGGTESLLVFPEWLERDTALPGDGPGRRSAIALSAALRRPIRRSFDRLVVADRPVTEWLVRRLGFRTRVRPEDFRRSYEELVSSVLDATDAHVVLVTIHRGSAGPFTHSVSMRKANSAVIRSTAERWAAEGRVVLADVEPETAAPRDVIDGAHLNDGGHARVAAVVARAVVRALARRERLDQDASLVGRHGS